MSRGFKVPILLPADPTAALEAATKQYVDNAPVFRVFATTTARDAWASPPNGALAITTDTNSLWQRQSGAWQYVHNLSGTDLELANSSTGRRVIITKQAADNGAFSSPLILAGGAGITGFTLQGFSDAIKFQARLDSDRVQLWSDKPVCLQSEGTQGSGAGRVPHGFMAQTEGANVAVPANVATTVCTTSCYIKRARTFQVIAGIRAIDGLGNPGTANMRLDASAGNIMDDWMVTPGNSLLWGSWCQQRTIGGNSLIAADGTCTFTLTVKCTEAKTVYLPRITVYDVGG